MALSSLSKNSMGIFFALLLVILLSESRLFKIFTNTYLGRVILISIILFVSYLNKILATVCVFIIVIMFSIMKPPYEGFDVNKQDVDENAKKDEETAVADGNKSTPAPTTDESKETSKNKKIDVVTSASTDASTTDQTTSPVTTIEGFDIQRIENDMRIGKQSNSIPVNKYNKQQIEVDPYEGSSFSNFFGVF
jgi:cytoskeletal protein RodZ